MKNQTKGSYTPGPWTAWDTGNGMGICPADCTDALIPNVAAFQYEICRIKASDKNFDAEWPTVKANARLIAAAPELLEALENLKDNFDYPPKAYEIILKAIAKATGDTK